VEIMQQDFDAELRVEKIEFNPYVLSLRISGLELDNPEGEPTARLGEAFANFQLSSLFRLTWTFDEIRFSSPELFVARDKSGVMDFSYLLNSADEEVDDVVATDDEDSSLPHALVFNFAIENFVVNWSDQFPVDPVDTRFGPIDIDIKELNTLPNRSGQQTVVIAAEDIGTLSLSGDLQLNPLQSSGHARLEDSQFPLLSAYIRHQTGLDIVDGSADLELDYEVHQTVAGELKAGVTNFNLTFTDIAINSYADGTGFDFSGEDRQILLLPEIRLSEGQFHWPEQTVSLGSISIDKPQINMSRDKNGVFNLEPREMPSETQSAGAETVASENDQGDPADQWQLSIGNLAVNGLLLNLLDQTVTPEAKLGITEFNLSVSDISNLPGKHFPTSLSLQALSGGQVSLKGEVSVLPELLFDLDVDIDAVQLTGVNPYIRQQANLNMDSGAVNLEGHISGSSEEPLLFKGDLEIVDLDIAESINKERLASWKRFKADKIVFSSAKQQLDISRLHFDELYGDILIDEDSNLNVGQIKKTDPEVADAGQAANDTETKAEGTDSAFKLRIGDIVLANASANFSDLSLPLPFAVKIDALNGKLTTISTESSEPSEVSFEGKVNEYGLARVSGFVTPLKPVENTDLLVAFENINVPSLTPYSIPFSGREIASGKLDLKLGYQVKDSEMVGANSIVLRNFEIGDEVPHPDALDLPLGLAVALLKDANGKIDLDLPVRGNVDDPEFSYGGVVSKALGKSLTKIISSPFSALGNILGLEASELEHVKFLDGRSDLTPPEMEKTAMLAEALSLRPELQLSIAGVFDSAADGLALRTAQLDTILEQRLTEVAAASDPETQYADQRRMALEQLFGEQLSADVATPKLQELRQQFTTMVEVEGQTEPTASFDSLAFANELRDQLIGLQVIDDNDLAALASARSEALRTALLAIDESLQERVLITENVAVTRKDEQPIKMKITLGSASG